MDIQASEAVNPKTSGWHDTRGFIVSAPVPLKTQSYSPIPHGSVIDMTMEQIDKAGLKVTEERYGFGREGKQAIGFYKIGSSQDPEMGIELIWHNSYDKSMSLKWAIGGKVFVCKNGMVSGDIGAFKRKHTGEALLDYEEAVKDYVSRAGDLFHQLIMDKERMKEIEITKTTCAELIGRMYLEDDIINSTQLNVIKRELTKPSYNYNADGSLWQLYNHCTVALKEAHPQFHLQQHVELHDFFKKEYAI